MKFGAMIVSAALMTVACAVLCAAQTMRIAVRQTPPAQTPVRVVALSTDGAPQGTADEDFDLNIPERRITRENFFASTELMVGDEGARGLSLRVGVEVWAERIDVMLRNVQGHVRFHGSLDAVRRLLDARRAPSAEQPRSVP